MGQKRLLDKAVKGTWIWIILFAVGIAVGVIFYRNLLALITPILQSTAALVKKPDFARSIPTSAYMVMLYVLKNSLVALICIMTGRVTLGLFPGMVVIINGIVIGFAAIYFRLNAGILPWQFAAALAPHGVFELFAIFLSCSIGMLKIQPKNRYKLIYAPIVLLVVAALMETFVSPLVLNILK